MEDVWERLVSRLRELTDLYGIAALLEWDQAAMMPAGGGPARARAIATLHGIAHARLADPELGDLIAELEDDDSLDADGAASVRILRRDYDRATKVPRDLVTEIARCRGLAYQAWTAARPDGEFARLQPHLEALVRLKKDEADAIGWDAERYDALLDGYEPGMTTARVEDMFDALVAGLKPLADRILGAAGDPSTILDGTYGGRDQEDFCRWLADRLGFDSGRGRIDSSPHPFTCRVSSADVRHTTRPEPRSVLNPVYAAIHETGHALYEQGLPPELADLPAGRPASLGLHESQSRLWENHVGRGRAFTDWLLPHLKERWPQLSMVTPDAFYRTVNHPRRSLIRVHADEVTYNLHIALRFEIELELFRDRLEVAELPEAFDDKMEQHLGMRPPHDGDGVLQDMHWAIGALGYFPTYTLGTLYAAAFYERAAADIPDLDADIRAGRFSPLLDWLRANIHSRGFRVPARELGERILGEPLGPRPFLAHIESKYGGLYPAGA